MARRDDEEAAGREEPAADACAGLEIQQQWREAVLGWRWREFAELAAQGCDLDAPVRLSWTPLGYSVTPFGGCIDAVKELVRLGADPSLPGFDGKSLVELAREGVCSALEARSSTEIIAYLESLPEAGAGDC